MKRGIARGILTVGCLAVLGGMAGAQELARERDADVPRLRPAEPERVGDDSMREAVTTMLIAEAELVGRAADDRTRPREQPVAPILEKMYEAMDDVLDGFYEDAIPKLEAVLDAEPTLHPVWSTLGWAYWEVGREEDAIALWERLLALNPGHPLPHTHLGNAYAGLGEMARAEAYLDRAVELDPTEIRPRLLLGALYRWTARYEKSIKILTALLDEHPDRLDVKLELALSLYYNRQYEEALPLLSEVRRWHPDNHELVLAEARALLHTGRIDEATRHAEHILARDGDNIEILMLLADAPQYKDSPTEAIPYLERILQAGPEGELKLEVMRRLIELYSRMYAEDPYEHRLDRSVELALELVEMQPDRPEWRIALGELNLLRFGAVRPDPTPFEWVLEHANTNSLRANLGLFELYQASRQYRAADRQLEIVRELTGDDPYHPSRVTRFELSRGSFRGAYAAIDELEARGARGAVAVLLYRELSGSDWADVLSARRFRLQLLALKQAGYHFITPDEIPRYLRERPAPPRDLDEAIPDRVVCVTFDDASHRTLELADEVARDLDIVMAMHLPVARIERGDPLVADWETIRRYAATGRWAFGSYLLHGSERAEMPDGYLEGAQIANRLWDADAAALESDVAFERRIRQEYARSRAIIRRELGADAKANFVAYPYSDMGQGMRSDVLDAIAINLREAAINYEIGFVESPLGHAMRDGNPLLYPRFAPDLLDSGQDVLAHLHLHHPLVMARRLRLETASLEGRPYRALRMLDLLERDGFPPQAYARSETYVYERLARKLGVDNPLARSHRPFFDLVLASPYAGARFEYFRDNANRRNWETRLRAGIDLTSQLQVEGHAGYGGLRQRFSVIADEQGPGPELDLDRFDLSVRERHAGVSTGVRIDPAAARAAYVQASAFARHRQFRGDADFDRWAYGAVLALRPFLVWDVNLAYEHNVEPSARALVKRIDYEVGKLDTVVRVRDWWDLNGAFHYFDYSDENDRINSSLSSVWEVSERAGLLLGLQYMFHHSSHPRDEYWTPNKLHQYLVMVGLKNRWRRFAFDARGMVGRGRQDVRRRDLAAYDELVIRAEALQFDAGDPPRENWQWIVAGNLTLDYGLGRWADAFTTASYNRVPGYRETRATTGLRIIF